MIDQIGNEAQRAEKKEARREDDEDSLSNYIVINPQVYHEMKEEARKEYEQKAKRGKLMVPRPVHSSKTGGGGGGLLSKWNSPYRLTCSTILVSARRMSSLCLLATKLVF